MSCNLSDGVILGVDSAVTLPGPEGIEKVYENAEKLFQLGERPIGVATYGMSALETRNIGSLIREFEVSDPGGVVSNGGDVPEVVEGLREFFMDEYRRTMVPIIERELGRGFDTIPHEQYQALNIPAIGLAVGGFSPNEYLSEVWNIIIPFHDQPGSAEQVRPQGEFASNWFAMNEPIYRYTIGYDPALMDELMGYIQQLRGTRFIDSERQQIQQILAKYEYPIPFAAMPMEEGVAYTRFLVELVINHHRFAVGAPVVGGGVRIGKVTYRGEQFQILEG